MRRHEFSLKRLQDEIDQLKPPPPPEELAELRAAYPGMEVMVTPDCIRLAPMYNKTGPEGSKPE